MSYVPAHHAKVIGNKNPTEANEIVDFIVSEWPKLSAKYKAKPIQDILAVVTPYRERFGLIHQLLKEAFTRQRDNDPTIKWPSVKDVNEITVNTVHSLQGAEKPIVLFSSMNNGNKANLFFKEEPNLINVAVSRAKDAFIAFICPKTYGFESPDVTASTPHSSVHFLGQYLRDHGSRLCEYACDH